MENLWIVGAIAVAAVFGSIAGIIREHYKGRALLVRAERGDPEPTIIILTAPRRFLRRPGGAHHQVVNDARPKA